MSVQLVAEQEYMQMQSGFKPTFQHLAQAPLAGRQRTDERNQFSLSSSPQKKSSHRKHTDPTRCSQKDGTIPSHVSSLWTPLFTFLKTWAFSFILCARLTSSVPCPSCPILDSLLTRISPISLPTASTGGSCRRPQRVALVSGLL